MSFYDGDPRVDKVHGHLFTVVRGDDYLTSQDIFDVTEKRSGGWWTAPSLANPLLHVGGRAEAERILAEHTCGPYDTADEAIKSLIGDPW